MFLLISIDYVWYMYILVDGCYYDEMDKIKILLLVVVLEVDLGMYCRSC